MSDNPFGQVSATATAAGDAIGIFMPPPHKNNTFATLLALTLGGLGVRRSYLQGSVVQRGSGLVSHSN